MKFAFQVVLFLAWSIALGPVSAQTEGRQTTVEFPLRFDQVFLTDLLRETVFGDKGGVSVWGDESGCNDLTLSNPVVLVEEETPWVLSDASARTGVNLLGRCVPLINWQGKIKARQRVDVVDPSGLIAFSTLDTELLDTTGNRATVSNAIWEVAQETVYPRLDRFAIDLRPAVKEIRDLLPMFFRDDAAARGREIADSLSVSRVDLEAGSLSTVIQFESELTEIPEVINETPLSDQEIALFEEIWTRWDGFLGFVIKFAGRQSLTEDEQDTLLGALIDTRYMLVDALSRHTRDEVDPVRKNFVDTWQTIRPVFQSLSLRSRGGESLKLLSFIAATDALEAIDSLGETIGWDISVDGMRRLARLLIDDGTVDPLEIDPATDPELRRLFDFGPSLELPPAQGVPSSQAPGWIDSLVPISYAAVKSELDTLYPTSSNIDEYLEEILVLLQAVSAGTLDVNPLDNGFHGLFEDLVLTTAWQETCWRQYKKRKGTLQPVVSSAGALGIMQIMPRVWRGFYDEASLGNSIEYNAAAGSEILHRYLVRYALRKKEHEQEGGVDNLVRATYAAYNGGPRHLKRYRLKETSASLRRIDQAFWSKFEQVRSGDELAVKQCYPY